MCKDRAGTAVTKAAGPRRDVLTRFSRQEGPRSQFPEWEGEGPSRSQTLPQRSTRQKGEMPSLPTQELPNQALMDSHKASCC